MPNTLLWIGQGLLATLFALTGAIKLIVPRERLQVRMHWARTWPRWRIRLLGLAELAGAIGLVLPRATGIAPLLTPVAAACLAVLMIGAAQTHRQLRESPLPAAVVGLLCLGLAAALLATSVSA
jgi:DoxX-like family